jgi:hypothetical protein
MTGVPVIIPYQAAERLALHRNLNIYVFAI